MRKYTTYLVFKGVVECGGGEREEEEKEREREREREREIEIEMKEEINNAAMWRQT